MSSKEYAMAYSKGAELAGTRGVAPSHYAPGQASGSRAAAWNYSESVPPSDELSNNCSAMTRGGAACKARPIRESDLCVAHTRQKASNGQHDNRRDANPCP